MLVARMAGCACSVNTRSDSGPSKTSWLSVRVEPSQAPNA